MLFHNFLRDHQILLAICLSLLINSPAVTGNRKCLKLPQEVPRRYIHYEGVSLNLTIESSNRPTHQIISYIFKIFVQEMLGYPNVNVIDIVDDFDVDSIVTRLSGPVSENHRKSIPKSVINLEVWIPPHKDMVDLLRSTTVKEYGILRPPSTFGWFIPKSLTRHITEIDRMWHHEYGSIPWTMFNNRDFISAFVITNQTLRQDIERLSMVNSDKKIYYCNDKEYCKNGYYTPETCLTQDCALLLAPYFNGTEYVIDQIDRENLKVKVLWLGDNLKTAMNMINATYLANSVNKSFVVLSWSPSEIIYPEDNYINIDFRQCDPTDVNISHPLVDVNDMCPYEMWKIEKLMWNKLEDQAPVVYDTMTKIHFNRTDYQNLLDIYYKFYGKSYEQMACEWLRRNQNWATIYWTIPTETVPTIHIGGIFPIQSTSYKGTGIVHGARMAIKAANELIFTNYKLSMYVLDGQCKAEKVMKAFIDYIKDEAALKTLVGVLGPACSETVEPIASVSRLFRTLVISYSAEGASFADREKYPYFFRTIGSNTEFMFVYLELMKQMKWNRVAALTEDGQKYTEYLSVMQNLLMDNGISFIANVKFPRERKMLPMTTYLETLKKKRSKIIIADINDEAARAVMCEASKLEMTMKHGYVWFLPSWLNETWYNTTYYNQRFNESVDCPTNVMVNAINGYFSITHSYWAPNDAIMQENRTVAEWKKSYREKTNNITSDYAGFAYDAVWTYALALDKLIRHDPEALTDLHSENATKKLVKYVQETDFNGVSGKIKFRGGPSRFSTTIHVTQWCNHTRTIVGWFYPNITDNSTEILGGVLNLNLTSIKWMSGRVPDDGREPADSCLVDGVARALNVSCEWAMVLLNVVFCSGLIGMIAFAFCYYKKKLDNRISKTQLYMQHLGLDMTNLDDLDKWEIPREHVVINRKLGQGAFGTVYGGEALIDPENGWVAVAVKTLKMGSTAEEKIDFLSEAEAMKRFDHKNVVRLLGLCTRNEPVYTIMEFMLYGDLKTFLLARRHLVRTKSEEYMEVSSKKLTSMALDIARALSYLAEKKYVHRDVASRNCLVNASRVVKLADFGMTRAMYESDYYKFNRKGMLPVRWMAPESLSLGVFSTSSDIWSYGVLLYEIITFGSFPFQGLSNNQVLDYVKNGHTLDIPSGVKPQLEVFLKSCWNQESKRRPKASEIVEFLANNPQLISPCIEGPIAAVEMEGTDDLEVHLPGEFRKQSSVTSRHFPNGDITRSQTIQINNEADMIQLEHVCTREPLLKSSTSFTGNTTGYVHLQSSQPDLLSDSEIDYSQHNGNLYTKCN
ncbi:protein kinase [Oryctes borbonicus]|uniref:receptor protein-tyrosine kinase n=1 Tax=Oryctes borbonicus TaxID=1629725 RepID=A0A0T6BGX6_9SCAR|nr:protein kinase [Oryctes borbonicus]